MSLKKLAIVKSKHYEYLDSLYEAQELFLELMVENADYYTIEDGETVGYFILAPEQILILF